MTAVELRAHQSGVAVLEDPTLNIRRRLVRRLHQLPNQDGGGPV